MSRVINTATLIDILKETASGWSRHHDELTQLDSVAGDGDRGVRWRNRGGSASLAVIPEIGIAAPAVAWIYGGFTIGVAVTGYNLSSCCSGRQGG